MVQRRPGSDAIAERLTETLFFEIVQSHLHTDGAVGLLAGLRDPLVGRALALLHAKPAEPWTVDELVRRVGASRSALSDRFRDTVGATIMKYLTEWRMELAAARLLDSHDTVAAIAADVGYESEASFNRAFRRHAGQPPATWRREHT